MGEGGVQQAGGVVTEAWFAGRVCRQALREWACVLIWVMCLLSPAGLGGPKALGLGAGEEVGGGSAVGWGPR